MWADAPPSCLSDCVRTLLSLRLFALSLTLSHTRPHPHLLSGHGLPRPPPLLPRLLQSRAVYLSGVNGTEISSLCSFGSGVFPEIISHFILC